MTVEQSIEDKIIIKIFIGFKCRVHAQI